MGFSLGLQAGSARIHESGGRSASAVATQLQLGWGLSESVRISSTTQADLRWSPATPIYEYTTLSFEGYSTAAELAYYPGGAGRRWFGLVGLGVGAIHDRAWGLSYHAGVGWDIWRGAQLQWTLARYGGTDGHIVSDRITIGWLWR